MVLLNIWNWQSLFFYLSWRTLWKQPEGWRWSHWSVSLLLAKSSGFYFLPVISLTSGLYHSVDHCPSEALVITSALQRAKHMKLWVETLRRKPSRVVWHPGTFLSILRLKEKWWWSSLSRVDGRSASFVGRERCNSVCFCWCDVNSLHWGEQAPHRETRVERECQREEIRGPRAGNVCGVPFLFKSSLSLLAARTRTV